MKKQENPPGQSEAQNRSPTSAAETPPSDIDRYERLQKAAETQIENVWKAYKLLMGLVAVALVVIGGIASWFLLSDIREFKKQTHEDIKEEKDVVMRRVEARIDDELKTENVQKLIAKK